jgi:2-dehydro-3-deoxygalactonokinase
MPDMMVLLDVGSTNSRAWLVEDGAIVRRATAAVGVRDSARTGTTTLVRATVRDLVRELAPDGAPARVAAAGMITSPLGLAEVKHVLAPASVEDLARGCALVEATDVSAAPILLVPGVRTEARGGAPGGGDVMRGEETLAVGLLAQGALAPGGALLTVGSHWKLTIIDAQGRIASSRTSLGGETVQALQSNTILSSSLPTGPLPAADARWVEAGAAAAREHGLLRAAFMVRLLDLQGGATPDQRFNWLVGACAGDDLASLQDSGILPPAARVVIAGPSAVPAAWGQLLRAAGHEVAVLDTAATESAFVAGLLSIVARRDGAGAPPVPESRRPGNRVPSGRN